MLFQFGFDPGSLELLVEIAMADPQIANELTAVLDELDWQFIDLDGRFAAAERSSVWS
ncbi:MAG: hypothetical protein IPN81_12320 [Nitrosomonadales bacterium]|nr:hypothetical protein [Nitrosomonadales bacterium]